MKQTVCDRCHGQKLRCDRDAEDDESCRRCRRAGAVCTYPNYEDRSHGDSRERRPAANRRSSSSSQMRAHTQGPSTHQIPTAPPSSTSSTFYTNALSPPLAPSGKRSISDLDDGLPSPVPTLHSTNKRQIFTGRSMAEEPSDYLTAGLYDESQGSLFDFMGSSCGVTPEFETMPNPLQNWQQTDRHTRDAWSIPSRADPFTPLLDATPPSNAERWERSPRRHRPSLHSSRRPLVMLQHQQHQQPQQRQYWPSMDNSHDSALDILIGSEPRMFSDMPSPTSTAAIPSITPHSPPWPSPSRSKPVTVSTERLPLHEDNHMHIQSPIENGGAKLFQLYTSLAQWSNSPLAAGTSPAPTVAEAYQHTNTLISILHSSLSYHHRLPIDRHSSPNPLTTQQPQPQQQPQHPRDASHSPSDRTPYSHDSSSHVQPDDDLATNGASILPAAKDPTLVFLILACAYRLLRLYQRIVEDVDASLRRAIQTHGTRGCCLPVLGGTPGSTPESGSGSGSSLGSNLGSEAGDGQAQQQPSAMEWVQTVSATLHLAEKMNRAVRLLAVSNNNSSNSGKTNHGNGRMGLATGQRGFRGQQPHEDEFGEYTAYDQDDAESDRDGRPGGELDGVVAEPMKQIAQVSARLWRSMRDVINRIRTSNLL